MDVATLMFIAYRAMDEKVIRAMREAGVNMTVAHYEFTRGASIHEHHHPQEELYEVLEGQLELTVDGVAQVARPGVAASCRATRGTQSGR